MLLKKGKKLHRARFANGGNGGNAGFGHIVAKALNAELGTTHQGVKTVMRWTGASERAVKHWFAGTHGPNGEYLIALMQHSDLVLTELLLAADRRSLCVGTQLSELRVKLLELAELMDDATV